MSISFHLLHRDGAARAGLLATPHGPVETPVFMPVGTQATVKGLTPDMVRSAGARIILGNTYDLGLRAECARELVAMDFPGYALGGFSVGESPEAMHAALPTCAALLPEDKPRYLMGVGRPEDLLEGVAAGIDLFDCVMPTRNGRNALAFTYDGPVRLRNARHRRDPAPLESGCPCYGCRRFARAYLHHLFQADEMLGPIL